MSPVLARPSHFAYPAYAKAAISATGRLCDPKRLLLTPVQGEVDAVQKSFLVERLGEKADGPRLDGACPYPLFGEGRHYNDGNLVTSGNDQINAAHTGHPDICDDTRNIFRPARAEKLFRGCKVDGRKSQRF
jgi:hypothetical protein